MIVEINWGGDSAGWAGGGAEGLEVRRKRLKYAWLDGEEVELAFAPDEDKPCAFKLLDVM